MSEKDQECSECGKPLAHRVHSPANGTHAYREPVASPPATRPTPIGTCDNTHHRFEKNRPTPHMQLNTCVNWRAAQPAAGTTPRLHTFECGMGHRFNRLTDPDPPEGMKCEQCDATAVHVGEPSEGTTPQAERPKLADYENFTPAQTVWPEEALHLPAPEYPCADCGLVRNEAEGGRVFTVCDKCWDKMYKARAVAPVETANFVQLLPGGMCFAHGRYEGYQCPQWPKCITDPQKQEYLAQAQTLNATTFGDAGEG